MYKVKFTIKFEEKTKPLTEPVLTSCQLGLYAKQ